MSATFLGSPVSGAKVLRKQDYAKERNGLETLNESYTIRTVDRLTLQPERGTSHTSFSTASTKFARMAVETVAFNSMDGDLSEMTVTFVGLTSSAGLPAPIINTIPMEGAGIFGPNIQIQVEFCTNLIVVELLNIYTNPGRSLAAPIRMPATINGFPLPPNPPPKKYGMFIGGDFTDFYEGYCTRTLQTLERVNFNIVTILFQEYSSGFIYGKSF